MSIDGPTAERRFLVDRMLGKLATYLVMLGYDALYLPERDRPRMQEIAREQGRCILSRDTRMPRRLDHPSFLFVEDDQPINQLKQVVKHFGLVIDPCKYLTRCLHCNERLVKAPPEQVKSRVPAYILTVHRDFSVCPVCNRVYWKGSHRKRMEEMMRRMVDSPL